MFKAFIRLFVLIAISNPIYCYATIEIEDSASPLNHNCPVVIETIRHYKLASLGGLSMSTLRGYLLSRIALQKQLSAARLDVQTYLSIKAHLQNTLNHLDYKLTAIEDYLKELSSISKLVQELNSTRNESLIDLNFYRLLKQELIEFKKIDSLINAYQASEPNAIFSKNLLERLDLSIYRLTSIINSEPAKLTSQIMTLTNRYSSSILANKYLRHLPLLGALLGGTLFVAIDLLSYSHEVSDSTIDSWVLKDENFFSTLITPDVLCRFIMTSSHKNRLIGESKVQFLLKHIEYETSQASDLAKSKVNN